MKLTRFAVTTLLLLFVAATVGTLIAQETVRPERSPVTNNEPDLLLSNNDIASVGQLPSETESQHTEPREADEDVLLDPIVSDSTVSLELPAEDVAVAAEGACMVEAVYFHNTHRCVTCVKIESDAKAIVEDVFADELAAGVLRWSAINMEDHPTSAVEYGLASPSLVLLRKHGDQVIEWIVLEETWALVRSTTRYSAYISDSFSAFLDGRL